MPSRTKVSVTLFMIVLVCVVLFLLVDAATDYLLIPHRQRLQVYALAKLSLDFRAKLDRWPENLSQSTVYGGWTNATIDLFGNDILYEPYDAERGYGSVTSYGADVKPGGRRLAKDWEARFSEDGIKVAGE